MIQPAWADRGYRLTLAAASTAGSVELQRGDYTLHLHDGGVVLTSVDNGREYPLEAKVDNNAERKFTSTAIHTERVGEARVIQQIRLAGTRTTVVFAQK
ncbi:MAG: hypothetical protein JST11_02710 [Acidobacteria bacterium]|nr:hypothetical protein [Acidobacteriota bacterium]